VSIAELINKLNTGDIKVVKIKYKRGDGYYVSFGPEMPREYDIIEVRPGLVVYLVGEGSKKAWKSQYGTRYRVPAKAGPKEGFAFAEFRGNLVYLYLG